MIHGSNGSVRFGLVSYWPVTVPPVRFLASGVPGEDPGIDEALGELAEPYAEDTQVVPSGPSSSAAAVPAKVPPPEQRVFTLRLMDTGGYEVQVFRQKKMRERDRRRMMEYIQRRLNAAAKDVKDWGVGSQANKE